MNMAYFFSVSTFLLLQIICVSSFSISLDGFDKNGCSLGKEFRGGSCRSCRPGSYRFFASGDIPTQNPFKCLSEQDVFSAGIPPNNNKCEKCPAGTYNPFAGSQTPFQCKGCPSGTTSDIGAKKCKNCPNGKSSAFGSPVCATCQKGWYFTKPCTIGVRPLTPCTICPKGSYTDSNNSNECIKCPDGTSTMNNGATSGKMCKPCGTKGVLCSCQKQGEPMDAVSSYRPIGHSRCTRCPPGTRAKSPFATSAKECILCPKGTAYVYLEGCMPCPEGEYSFGFGASYCRKKAEGICPFDSFKAKNGVCKICETGYKRSGQTCVKCPPGSVSEGHSSTTCKKCIFPNVAAPNGAFCSCGPDYFKDYDHTNRCVPCPKGTKMESSYHDNGECIADCENFPGQRSCIPCKVDYERDHETQTCKKCPEGLRSLVGEERCEDPKSGCPAGSKLEVRAHRYGFALSCSAISSI